MTFNPAERKKAKIDRLYAEGTIKGEGLIKRISHRKGQLIDRLARLSAGLFTLVGKSQQKGEIGHELF